MNDNELDRLLDTWEAPSPPATMREGLRARFPRPERRRFAHWRKWVLLTAAASATLTITLGQSGANPWTFQLTRFFEGITQSLEAWRAREIVSRVRQSDPKVYVDGQLASPPNFGPAARINIHVPGDGVYSIISMPGLAGWAAAGQIHGSVVEFKAGNKQVRIECNKPIVRSDLPIFVRRQP
jgi:hypothetical protein